MPQFQTVKSFHKPVFVLKNVAFVAGQVIGAITVKFVSEISKNSAVVLFVLVILILAVAFKVVPLGIITVSEPSFGVLLTKVVKEVPPLEEICISMFGLNKFVLFTDQVIV